MDASIVVRLIDETKQGFNDIQRNLASVDNSSKALTRTMSALETAATGFVAALASKRVIDFIDSVQTMDNKLKLVEKSQGDVNIRFNELFDVAQRTRAPIAETVDLYSKLAQNQSVVGKTGAEITKVVEAFNTAMTISGTTGNAASGAITQFAQAMQSGKLQGDEFRSIAEAVPKVLEVLAQKTGIAREELKELASKGFINAKIVAQALSEALPDLQAEMDRTSKTVRGAITNMTNEFTKLGRSFLDSSGTSDALVQAIDHITKNADNLIPIIKLLGIGLAALAIYFAPVTAALIGLTIVVVKFADTLGPLAQNILDAFGKAIDYVMPKISGIGAALMALIKLEDPFEAYSKSMKAYQEESAKSKVKTDDLGKATQNLTEDQKKNAGPSAEMARLMKENGLANALAGIETMKFNQKLQEQIALAGLDGEAKQRQQLINEGLSAKAKDLKKSVEDLTAAQRADVIATVDGAMVKITKANEELDNRKRVFKESVDLLNRFADESRKQQDKTLTETDKFNKDLFDIETAYQNAMLNSKGKSAAEMKKIEEDYQAAIRGIHVRGLNDLFNEYKKYTETTQTKAEQFRTERSKIEEAYRIAQLDANNQTFEQQKAIYEKYQMSIQGLQAKYGADFKKAAEDFRNSELDGNQKYLKAIEELNVAYYEQGVISNKDYNDLVRKANKDFAESTVKEYGNLYGLLNEKLLQWSGLSQKEYGIVKDTFKLVFGVDVEDLMKQFFASAIRYVLGFRTSATGDLNGIGGVISGIFGKGGTGLNEVGTFGNEGQGILSSFVNSAGSIFGGITGILKSVFGGGVDIIGSFIKSGLDLLGGFGSSIGSIFSGIGSTIGNIFSSSGGGSSIISTITDFGGSLLGTIGDVFGSGITDTISSIFSSGSGGSSILGSLGTVGEIIGGVGSIGVGAGLVTGFAKLANNIFPGSDWLGLNQRNNDTFAAGARANANNANAQQQNEQLYAFQNSPEGKKALTYQAGEQRIKQGNGDFSDYIVRGMPYPANFAKYGLPNFNTVAKELSSRYGIQVSKNDLPKQYYMAKGGILNGPTMLGSNVIAGEAGAEAVLPLNRGSNGELGVNVNGMGTVNVNFNITAVDAQGIDELLLERKQFITNMIRSAVADRGKVLY